MKNNLFHIFVRYATAPSENGESVPAVQTVQKGTEQISQAPNDKEANDYFRWSIEGITQQHLEKEVDRYEKELEALVKTALESNPWVIPKLNSIIAAEWGGVTAEAMIAGWDYKGLYVSEKIIQALFPGNTQILQKYNWYVISSARLSKINIDIVERGNFVPRMEKVRKDLLWRIEDPALFETLRKELRLPYKTLDEWKAKENTDTILNTVYIKNSELAQKIFPSQESLKDDIAEYQGVLWALESFKLWRNALDAQINRDKKMSELLEKIHGMSQKITVLAQKMDDKDIFKSSLIALQKDIWNPEKDALQIRSKIFQDAINIASKDTSTRMVLKDIFQEKLSWWKEMAMGDTPGMEWIMQLNENSSYEDFVANPFVRTKFMESNAEVKSAILAGASPLHHDDILEIYDEITELYGIQSSVRMEEKNVKYITEQNSKKWEEYANNDTFWIEKWRNTSDNQNQNSSKGEGILQEIKWINGWGSMESVSVSQLMDKLQSDASLSEKLKNLPDGFELPIGKWITGKIEHNWEGLSLTIGWDTWNLGEKNPWAEYRRIQRLTMTPHFETLILPMGQDAIQAIYRKINLRPELLPLHNKEDTVISSFRFSYILTKVLDSIANKSDDTLDGISVDLPLSSAPNDTMESFQSYLSSNSAGLDSLYQKIQSKNDSLPNEKKVLDARGQVNPTMFLSLLDSVNFQVT